MSKRPHVLVITTDQQRWDALSHWGTPGVKTPHLDRLAAEGACFVRSYTPSPLCTPARISMITGQYSTRHGAWTIGMSPVPALQGPTLGSLFSDAGYATALIGKTHYVARHLEDSHVAGLPEGSPCPGSDFWRTRTGPYAGFQTVRHCRRHNADGLPNAHYRVWLEDQGVDMARMDALHSIDTKHCGRWEGMDPALTQNAWIVAEAQQAITQAGDRPWLVMANFQDPHFPYVCPEPYFSAVDMTGVDVGGVDPTDMAGRPPFYRWFQEHGDWRDDDNTPFWDGICISAMTTYRSKRDPRAAIQAYLGMLTMVDDAIGRLLQWLRDTGRYDDTLIIFTADHGDQLGRKGVWGKGPMAFDDNQRIPGLMAFGRAQTGPLGRVASHFNLVDIVPTACDAAGIPLPPGVQGISQLPVLRGETPSVRDWAIVDHIASRNQSHPELSTVDLHQLTFVWQEWKLVVYQHAAYGELYDLTNDPQQRDNLWDRAPERRADMLLRLARANLERTGTLPLRVGPC
jgi:uncharacterized sulfatase